MSKKRNKKKSSPVKPAKSTKQVKAKKTINFSPKIEINPETKGVLIYTLAAVIFLSLVSFAFGQDSRNWLGLLGYKVGWFFSAFFGLGSYILCGYIGWIGWRLMFSKPIKQPMMTGCVIFVMIFSFCIMLSLIEVQYPSLAKWIGNTFFTWQWKKKIPFHLGGAPFYFLYKDLPMYNLYRIFNTFGVALLCTGLFTSCLLYLSEVQPAKILEVLSRLINKLKMQYQERYTSEPVLEGAERMVKVRTANTPQPTQGQGLAKNKDSNELMLITPETNLKERPSLSRKEYGETLREPAGGVQAFTGPKEKEAKGLPKPAAEFEMPQKFKQEQVKSKRDRALEAQRIHNGDFQNYRVPGLNLLTDPKKIDQSSLKKDLRKQAEVLEETLMSFGIEAKVGQVNCGPTITSFEVHPAIGVKVQKIKTLENDIALNMEAKSIRIIAPIPGKAAVGIEVPNSHPQEVGFKDILNAYKQSGQHFHIPILLGKAVNGDYVMSDLVKMPHCIIAGATGSGKSVCINTIVMSVLMNANPDEIKMIMVDPKKVELTPYSKLPHMLAPVITEPHGACAALNWLVKEMELRYEILKRIGVRNIDSFNKRAVDLDFESTLGLSIPKKMQYIVCIIDELADLMMVASNDIETPIARIAQMARAVGIHLILATQRPSREVITGLIKANFPTRISFKVASRINSQIVLDETGAESLLGNGDMLFLPPGSSHLIRAQGAYIRDEDINGVIKQICEQAPPNYVIQSFDNMNSFSDIDQMDQPSDDLYSEAVDTVLSTGNASTTFLQRKLKVGYARAASLIDEMEKRGVVGPLEGSKPRKILVSRAADDEDAGEPVVEEALNLLKLE